MDRSTLVCLVCESIGHDRSHCPIAAHCKPNDIPYILFQFKIASAKDAEKAHERKEKSKTKLQVQAQVLYEMSASADAAARDNFQL